MFSISLRPKRENHKERRAHAFDACSNPSCITAGIVMTPLVRTMVDDKTSLRCNVCKRVYDAEILGTDQCPYGHGKMRFTKIRILTCPKCGRKY